MPKQKNSSTAKKRFKLTPSGKVKRSKQNKRHLLTDKETGRKRELRKSAYVSKGEEKTIKKLIGNN